MKSSDLKRYAPLLIVAGIILYQEFSSSSSDGADDSSNPLGLNLDILGTRTSQAMKDFTTALQPIADKVQSETGISARLGMIQSALESSFGASQLSRPDAKLELRNSFYTIGPALNLFGFKCGDAWLNAKKPYVLVPTIDYYAKGQKMPDGNVATKDNQPLKWPAPFRAYGSWEESYRDWARLMQIPMYVQDGALAALKADDLDKFGAALEIHYAPNQGYAQRISDRADQMGLA